MKLKNLFITLGLSLAVGIGVGAGLTVKQPVREAAAVDTGDCLIKGTVFYEGMDGDWTGVAKGTWNGSQFEVINLHLKSTDSFKFHVDGWGKSWYGYLEIDEEHGQRGLWNYDGDGNLSPKEDGYYNFYIQSGAMYTTQTEVEDVDDGLYLRGSVIGWSGGTVKLNGSGPYTITRAFAANEEVKAAVYSDGLSEWIAVSSVTCADSNYFECDTNNGNARIKVAGTYTLTVTLNGKNGTYAFVDSASAWCREFLDSMTCTADGSAEPVFKAGYSWNTTSASFTSTFNALDEIARNAINGADAVENGSVIQEAVSRYDTIVANHNYFKFIKNSSDVYRSANLVNAVVKTNANSQNIALIIVIISAFAIASVGGYFLLRKKKEN